MGKIQDYPLDQQLSGEEKLLASDDNGNTVNITINQVASFTPEAEISDGSITNAKLADAPADTLKGRVGTEGVPQDLTPSQVRNLLNVQDGATDDQTGPEIKSAYEGEPDTNAFTDSEKTKLANLSDNPFLGTFVNLSALNTAFPTAAEGQYAHVDAGVGDNVTVYIWDNSDNQFVEQTGTGTSETPASIKSKYESNADTNAFTDAEQTKLGGIETAATADQTPVEIKSAYESNADTNAFTDAEQTKLSGIEDNATADQTAAEVSVSSSPTNYTAATPDAEAHFVGINAALGSVSGGSVTNNFNNTFADSNGSGLVGTINGTNTTFTVSQSEYTPGTLMVSLNGQVLHNGTGINELTPASGIFDFETAPQTGDTIYVRYQVGTSGGGAGTDDQTATEVATTVQNGVTQANVQLELEKLNGLTRAFDTTPTVASNNAVTSGGVEAALSDINSFVDDNNINTSKITNFDTAVSSNADVAANTAKTGITVQQSADITANNAKVTNATHTGDVTGSAALTISNDAVTNSKLANMGINTIKGRITSGTGDPEDLTPAQVRTMLNVADGATSISLDATPTDTSSNGVTSGGVFTALGNINNFVANGAISGLKIADSTIVGAKLNPNSVTSDKLADNSVGQSELQTNSVSADEIDNSSNGVAPVSGQVPAYNGTDFTWTTVATQTSGTYTPVASGSTSGTHTAGTALGEWFRIGNIVHVRIRLAVVNGTTSGVFQVSLPFAGRGGNMFDQLNCSVAGNSTSFSSVQGEVNSNQVFITTDGGIGPLVSQTFTNGNIRISGTYTVN